MNSSSMYLRWVLPVWLFVMLACGAATCQNEAERHWRNYKSDYLGETALPLYPLIAPPPSPDSAAGKEDLIELHRLEQNRTPAQVNAAKADDAEEDIWIYRTVLGPAFSADKLPLTAAFQGHVVNEAAVATSSLKDAFGRVRPYHLDTTLHPVCGLTGGHNSYPSGHSSVGYLTVLTLVEMIPEKRQELLQRADEYAHNRLVCGVHYPSDIAASKLTSYVVFGELMKSEKFLADLKAARTELRAKLKLGPVAYEEVPK